jgi:excisionase family DNA binding protein
MNRHVTYKEIARILDCSTKTVKRKVDKGLIPAIQPEGAGSHIRFDVDEVLRAVKNALGSSTPESEDLSSPSRKEPLSGPMSNWKKKLEQKQRRANEQK